MALTPPTAPATLTGSDTLANVEILIQTVVTDWSGTNHINIEMWLDAAGAKWNYSISVLAPF